MMNLLIYSLRNKEVKGALGEHCSRRVISNWWYLNPKKFSALLCTPWWHKNKASFFLWRKIFSYTAFIDFSFRCDFIVIVKSLSMFREFHELHSRLPCLSLSPRVCLSSYSLSQWCYPTISSLSPTSPVLSLSQHQSLPMSQLFTSGGQSIGVSTSASVLPVNIQGWFPLGFTGLISLQSKGLSRVFSSNTLQKHQFFGSHPSLWFNVHISTWLLENP